MDYERKTKESLPVLAICYDFDKTLTPDNMQAQGYIQSVGYDVERFWEETDTLAHEHGMDGNLAYMYGFARRNDAVLYTSTVIIVLIVFAIQWVGDAIVKKIDKR